MNESTSKNTKPQKNKYNTLVVERLIEKHGFSKYYIHQCLRGERSSDSADKIRKDYAVLCKEVNAVLNK